MAGRRAPAAQTPETPKLPYETPENWDFGELLGRTGRAGSLSASFGIKGRKTGKIFGPGLDFRIQEAYITRMQELLQLERRKD